MNLVIVEDNELVLYQLLRMVARQPAIKVVAMATGEDDAVSAIHGTQPDAVLLDISLATGTGINVLKRIRAKGNVARVLVLTNYTDEPVRRICENYSIDGFYDKSREAETCLAHLYSWLPPNEGGQQ
jgi:DNA-binding NarL/FixJ family response regulator